MNPDELPERDTFQISYGDLTYLVTLTGTPCMRDHIRHQILADTHRALREFHGSQRDRYEREAKLKQLLFELASRYPQISTDRDFRNWAINGEVDIK